MLKIKGPWFIDDSERVVFLRGVNLGGSSKVPFTPDGATYRSQGFFDHSNVSFTGRPFPLEEADEHYQRLRSWGFNCLRFLITWEAVEHSGPGVYDEDYLDYLYKVVKKAGEHGFHVFIDPHQDVWSRFSGGDGAPGWTLECAGLDIKSFRETGAAIVHQTYGDPFPRMIWPTNAYKLAAATMFTLFFAGNDFAPATRVDGMPIQDYLQQHYLASIRKVAEKLSALNCVFGYDTMNEPQRGYSEVKDLTVHYGELDIGICPTPWQTFLLGSGFSQTVDILERNVTGTHRKGQIVLNREGKNAWLPGRQCVWRENGVWDIDKFGIPMLLKPKHFFEVNGRKVNFIQDYLLPFAKKYTDTIQAVNPDALIFLESEVHQFPPFWPDAPKSKVVYAAHWYDGVSLLFKRFLPFLAYDTVRNKVVFGKNRIIKSFREQLRHTKLMSAERLGNVPVLIGEIGIPYDMRAKKSFRDGNYSDQIAAMDRSIRALEDNLLSYTLWNYTSDNNNKRGDKWNDEDLSIFSRDQQKHPKDINSGGRALEAVVRPCPLNICGEPVSQRFNIKSGEFTFSFNAKPGKQTESKFFLPLIQYPQGAEVKVSDGEYHLNSLDQQLTYTPGQNHLHTIHVTRK